MSEKPLEGVHQIEICAAADADFSRITEIHAFEVLRGTATFELEPPGVEEMKRRHAAVVAHGFPWLIARVEGRVAGYAYAAPFRPRPAYDWTVEDSVYLDPARHGRGLGRALLARLVADTTALAAGKCSR